jgi:hypothetical protein
LAGELIHKYRTGVVAGLFIFAPGVTQAYDEFNRTQFLQPLFWRLCVNTDFQ